MDRQRTRDAGGADLPQELMRGPAVIVLVERSHALTDHRAKQVHGEPRNRRKASSGISPSSSSDDANQIFFGDALYAVAWGPKQNRAPIQRENRRSEQKAGPRGQRVDQPRPEQNCKAYRIGDVFHSVGLNKSLAA